MYPSDHVETSSRDMSPLRAFLAATRPLDGGLIQYSLRDAHQLARCSASWPIMTVARSLGAQPPLLPHRKVFP